MVDIELLDYKYSATGLKSASQGNFDGVTNQADWVVDSRYNISIPAHSGTDYIYPCCSPLKIGATYLVRITMSGKTGSDDIGVSSVTTAGTSYTSLASARRSTSGTSEATFTTTAANETLRIFAQSNAVATNVSLRVSLVGGVDFNTSILGRLDIGDSSDFPLAITFGVIDVRNLEERAGTYSKTFNIPATKNNNQVLRGLYKDGSFLEGNSLTNRKPCRIVFDGVNNILGKLQVTQVGKTSSPSYYSCVFYGDNVDWAASLSQKKLMDLSVHNGAKGSGWDNLNNKGANTGVDLKLQYDDVKDSWWADNALEKSQFVQGAYNYLDSWNTPVANDYPIVYPYVSYGEFGGIEGGSQDSLFAYNSIQLLKFWSEVFAIGTGEDAYWGANISNVLPTVDWRPGIFIYDIFKQIFAQEGFTISSAFIETAMFKKLIMLLPNFTYNNASERSSENGQRLTFSTGVVDSMSYMSPTLRPASYTYYPTSQIQWNANSLAIDDPNYTSSMLANSSFVIPEFGFYNINMSNIGAYLSQACNIPAGASEAASTCRIEYVKIICRTKMVGQSNWADWKTIATVYGKEDSTPADNYAGCNNFYPVAPTGDVDRVFNFDDVNIENRWLNKNDQVDFCLKWRFGHNDSTDKKSGSGFQIFGGSSGSTGFGNDGEVSIVLSSPSTVDWGNTFDLKDVIPDNSSQIDFLKGVTHAFNLQYRTDVNSKTVYIEPYDDFFKPLNEAIDWTNKVDLSQVQEDVFPETTLMSRIIFKFKTDSSDTKVAARASLYWDNILDEFPHKEDLSNEFKTGVSVFENPFFAGTYTTSDTHSKNDTLWTACLWKDCSDGNTPYWNGACRPEQGFSNLPRLLSWSKMECRSIDSTAGTELNGYSFLWTKAASTLSCNSGIPYLIDNMCLGRTIPKAVSRDFTMEDTSTTPFLCYGSGKQQKFSCDFSTSYSQFLDKGLYQTYWEKQIEQLKLNPKIKNVHIRLTPSDIANLDLRVLIYISGYYYRINKINDYIVGSKTTKVELLLWSEQGTSIPRDSFNNSGIMR